MSSLPCKKNDGMVKYVHQTVTENSNIKLSNTEIIYE